jgi:hypothetical protein
VVARASGREPTPQTLLGLRRTAAAWQLWSPWAERCARWRVCRRGRGYRPSLMSVSPEIGRRRHVYFAPADSIGRRNTF